MSHKRTPLITLVAACVSGCGSSSSHDKAMPTAVIPAPSASAQVSTSPPSPKVPTGDFGFVRVAESCSSFSAHITNATQTAYLDLAVGVQALGLDAGKHEVAISSDHVTATITELAKPHEGEWSCTDIGGGPQSKITAKWKATAGTLWLRLHEPSEKDVPQEGPFRRVDIQLIDVRVENGAGDQRTLNLKFDNLTIGWLPG